ncbi:MAG: serine/threonine-protein kinase, partial [Kofleriaceae bacterium]
MYERLGLGGMATVCRAKKRGPAGFERSVALKRMLSHLSEDQTFVESFIREAKVSSMLVHPNIAQVYDFGRINGTYYIAMELVPGFDLRKLLRYANRANESIPLPIVLSILGEMCDALEYAHTCHDEQGQPLRIVHRDISPSNIIVSHTGHTKLIDFGIAKANSRTLHTASGQVKGKLGYMSPEAALGMPIGPVSDVFSMGVVAWELVTASPLFSARTDFETMRKIREADVVKPSTHNPACPAELDQLILRALARDSTERLPSAAQFRRGLDEIAARAGIQVGTRAVGEWIRQYIQPDDLSRYSGRAVPQEAETSILRPSAKSRLQRSQDDIELAAEIWGDDAGAGSLVGDFSMSGPVANSTATPLPTQVPVGQVGAQPTAHYTPSSQRLPLRASPSYPEIPAGHMPSPMQQILPYAVPRRGSGKPSRTGLYLLLGLGAVAVALGIVLLVKRGAPAVTTGGENQVIADAGRPLVPAIAHVAIDSTPRGLPIELDGKPAGTTPIKLETLAGAHHVVVHGATEAWTKDFVANADASQIDQATELAAF